MKKKLKKILLVSFIILVLLFIYTLIEPYWIIIKSDKIIDSDIPDSFNNSKIIFLADIHHGPFFSIERVDKIVSKVNNLKPDIILLGGDYVHRDSKYIKPCINSLLNLKARYGVYAVLGNHDHWENKQLFIDFMDNEKIKLIDNKSIWINNEKDHIKIGGVGDYWEDTQDILPTTSDVSENDFTILLSHNPEYLKDLRKENDFNKIDLMLSGHTHGGQITFFGLFAPVLPIHFDSSRENQKFASGYVEENGLKIIVTNGVGTVTPPVRFFARPQINEIILQKSINK